MTQPIAKCTLPVQSSQSSMVSPKIHKVCTPLRPIVSSRGSTTYGVAKEMASIICPLVGQSYHHLKNTKHFIKQIQQVKLEQGEVISSYNVKALFNSVPVDPSINIVRTKTHTGPYTATKDPNVHTTHCHTSGVLPLKHLLPLPG